MGREHINNINIIDSAKVVAICDTNENSTNHAKSLINEVANQDIDAELILHTAKRIAEIRVSEEGQEGLSAFFDKRAPNWQTAAKQ